MLGRAVTFALAVLMLTSVLAVLPLASAEMDAPTLSGQPAINGKVDEAEWSGANDYTFNSPRSGSSQVRIGYLDESDEIAIGLVLADDTSSTSDVVDVAVAPRQVSAGEVIESGDIRAEIARDGSWTLYRVSGNNWTHLDSGSKPSEASGSALTFDYQDSVASWEVEILLEVGDFDADEQISTTVVQSDDDGDAVKQTARGNTDLKAPPKWEKTVLSGLPTTVGFRVEPAKMEAAVGGDIIVTLPADANSADDRLTVQVREPGAGGFTPIATVDANAGSNRFHFAPETDGNYGVQAVWSGDDDYGKVETETFTVNVARPNPGGATVMETGAMRMAFDPGAGEPEAVWEYLNTKAWATDGEGNLLDLVRLDSENSCRKEPWVGFANMAQGEQDSALVLHFDPPVRRGAIALASPEDKFDATWKAFNSDGVLKRGSERSDSGGCNQLVFAGVGSVEGDVSRIEIEYNGEDPREVVDVLFANPLESSPHAVTVRADPAPLHAGGASTLLVSAGSPFRINQAEVTVTSGATTLASETCSQSPGDVWLDCAVPVQLPAGMGSVKVSVDSTDDLGGSFTATRTLTAEADQAPPKASLLPRPLLATRGGAAAVTAMAEDASGIQNITVTAVDSAGAELASRSCEPQATVSTFECKLAVTPPASGFAWMTATITDGAGNVAEVGPKPIPVRDADTDGDGLPNNLELLIGTSPTTPDSDGDGLSDGWEVVGVDRDGNGEAELDLAALGADPTVRDIFIEVDWAVTDDGSYEPAFGALQLVRHQFAAHGINIHYDLQQEGGPFAPERFDHGHQAHRHLMDMERAGIFMHVLSGQLGGPAAAGGWLTYLSVPPVDEQIDGRVGAQLLQELGHHLGLGHGGGGAAAGDSGGQVIYGEDYKPNYLSVMNSAYAWGVFVDTVDGLVRVPTLSDISIGELDEKSLDEPTGMDFSLKAFGDSLRVGPTHALEEDVITGLQIRHTCPGQVRWRFVPGAIDWNCNGGSQDSGVEVDLNGGGENSGISTLESRTDWDNLWTQGPPCPHYGLALEHAEDTPAGDADHGQAFHPLGLAPCPLHKAPENLLASSSSVSSADAPPGDIEEADGRDNDGDGLVDEGFADSDGDGVVDLIDGCPRTLDANQLDADRNGRGDLCEQRPAQLTGLNATIDPETGQVTLVWDEQPNAWGYNVYRVSTEGVNRIGSSFPSTLSATMVDNTGSQDATYLVMAVNDLASQGPPSRASPVEGLPGGVNGTGGAAQEGVPGPGALIALTIVGLAALAARRRWA